MSFSSLISAYFEDRQPLQNLIIGLSIGVSLPLITRILDFLYIHFIHRSKLSIYHHPRSITALPDAKSVQSSIANIQIVSETAAAEPWALVTGATDGIGASYARSLSTKGFNIILHGRNPAKLHKLIADLSSQNPARSFIPLVADASDRSAYRSILDGFVQDIVVGQGLNLTILVNNIGGLGSFTAFMRAEDRRNENELEHIIDVNSTFPIAITQRLLPTLKQNSPALVVNLCSMTSLHGLPYLTIYCACKAFNLNWGRALRLEMQAEKEKSYSSGKGNVNQDLDVEILNLTLSQVKTTGAGDVPLSFFTPNSDDFVERYAISKIGLGRHRDLVCAYWPHALQTEPLTLMWRKAYDRILLAAGKAEYEMESQVRRRSRP